MLRPSCVNPDRYHGTSTSDVYGNVTLGTTVKSTLSLLPVLLLLWLEASKYSSQICSLIVDARVFPCFCRLPLTPLLSLHSTVAVVKVRLPPASIISNSSLPNLGAAKANKLAVQHN